MIEITISKEGEVKIKVDNQAQSVSASGLNEIGWVHDRGSKTNKNEEIIIKTDGECRAIGGHYGSIIRPEINLTAPQPGFAEFQQEVNEGIKKGDVKVDQIIPSEDCKRQNICGYEPQLKSGQLKYDPKNRLTEISPKTMDKIFGCKSGEIEGGPTY